MAQLQQRGLRVAVICSGPFLKLGRTQAQIFGAPDLPIIAIPHPLGGIGIEQVEGRAHVAWPQLEKLLRELLT
jgi:hypothetical protein